HYTGMFAVIFPENAMPAADNQLAGGWLGVPLSLTISVLIAMALLVVGLDMKVRKMLHQEAHQQAEKLQQMAFVDQASQLPNRSALEQALLKAMVVDQDAKQGFALLYLSMQNYRDIEDQLSDQDMSELATHLGILSQPGDFLARYASNSFVLMISNPKASRLENINKRLEILAYQVQPGGHSIDWRAGFSRYPHDGSSSRSLIRKAMANAQPLGNQLDTQPSELAIPAT
ncbi:MAG: diguanylate cyclase, partial [Pseudomonadaceae bacterium]